LLPVFFAPDSIDKLKKPRSILLPALTACLILCGAVLWYFRLIPLLWYWHGIPHGAPGTLGEYRVTLEALPLAGLGKNASALTYNRDSDTLFTAINRPPQIVELSCAGTVLRRIPVKGVDDLEGITHMEGRLYGLIDERRQQIYRVTIGADTERIDVADAPRLGIGIQRNGNLGFEGITWDGKQRRLFVAKEKPPRVFEIEGLGSTRGTDLQIHEWTPRQPFSRFMRDLSSLSRDDTTGHMLLLSDESRLLAEYDAAGELIGLMPLWRGFHGLAANVPQAEGVALGRNGTLYLISEPNLFYRFERR
jgi:uncharacterized protein YjiK